MLAAMEQLKVRASSRSATSTTASRAARRSASRSCRWRCSSRRSRSSTRPTRARHRRAADRRRGRQRAVGPEMGVLVITHYQRILNYIKPRPRPRLRGRPDRRLGRRRSWRIELEARGLRLDPARRRRRRDRDERDSDRDRGHPRDPRGLRVRLPRRRSSSFFKAPQGARRTSWSRRSRSMKGEPDWMREFRLKALDVLPRAADADAGAATSPGSTSRTSTTTSSRPRSRPTSWEDVPADIKRHVRQARHPRGRAEVPRRRRRAVRVRGRLPQAPGGSRGAGRDLPRHGLRPARARGARASSTSATVIPPNDNKFAALNSAVWSGGSFIYVPPGRARRRSRSRPTSASTRENMGQFERTLIIVDEGAYVHYVEGCTAPIYSTDSLHSAVVEIIVKKGGRCRYTTIQNWSNNVYNLVTKRAVAYDDATMEWVDGNLGSKLTMKYPAVYLMGEGAHGEVLSIAFAGKGQHQDAGAKMVHVRAEHHERDHLEVDLQGRRPRRLPRPARRSRRARRTAEVEGRLRRADPRRGLALRHLSVHRDRGGRRRPSATRRPSPRSATSSSSTS